MCCTQWYWHSRRATQSGQAGAWVVLGWVDGGVGRGGGVGRWRGRSAWGGSAPVRPALLRRRVLFAEAAFDAACPLLPTRRFSPRPQLPLFLHHLVMEKEGRLRELQLAMGMPFGQYVVGNYIFFMALFSLNAGVFWASGAFCRFRLFTQTGPSLLVAFFLGWGLALVSGAFFLSSFAATRQGAAVAGFCVALFGTLLAGAFATGVYGDLPLISLPTEVPSLLLAFPQVALSRGVRHSATPPASGHLAAVCNTAQNRHQLGKCLPLCFPLSIPAAVCPPSTFLLLRSIL